MDPPSAGPTTLAEGRHVGEPPVGVSYDAVTNTIHDAFGADAFSRTPATPDILLTFLESGRPMHDPLTAHLQGCAYPA